MPSNLLRTGKHKMGIRSSTIMPLDVWLVTQAELGTHFCSSFFVTKKDYFHVRMQQFPALQRIPLNDSIVALKWLCRGEERQHGLRGLFPKTPFVSHIPNSGRGIQARQVLQAPV